MPGAQNKDDDWPRHRSLKWPFPYFEQNQGLIDTGNGKAQALVPA